MPTKVILGVTGSVAATLTAKMVKALVDADMEVKVVSTERGLYFFDRKAINVPVFSDKDEWQEGGYLKNVPVPHIDFGDWADILLIAPLTADTLSDMAHGKADKFLTSIVLAWPKEKPLVFAPAMNTRMWENPITRANLEIVRTVYQIKIVGPVSGRLACGFVGLGVMARIEAIVAVVCSLKK